jgi:ABC-type phosphate/phosphonate transport system permease subunit
LTSEHEERITVEKIVGLGSPEATMLITLDKSQTRIKPARPHTNHQKVFFLVLVLVFFTGGYRKNRLPRNLKNTADLPNEFFQTNFEFNFFYNKTNRVCILTITSFWLGGVVATTLAGLNSTERTYAVFFFLKRNLT